MYLKKISLENVGPIENFELTPEFTVEANPKPIVVVGENGSGKSIFLSYIINGLLVAQQAIYENTEVQQGKVYKLRSADYVLSGKPYGFGKVEFSDELNFFEWQLRTTRKNFEDSLTFTPIHKEWNQIPEDEINFYFDNFHTLPKKVEENFNKNVILYFPPNRFEEPAWLNIHNLNARAEFNEKVGIKGITDRKIITISPLQINKNWLMDVLLDRSIYETQIIPIQQSVTTASGNTTFVPLNIYGGFQGKSENIYNAVLLILRSIVRKGENLRFGIGERRTRKISLMKGDEQVVPNIFQMSSGETALLNLFISILRDFDATGQNFNSLNDVTGIVVIDEIDLHLHTVHQRNVLPELIKLFPKIQFIVTTHSPLFILGLESIFGTDNFTLVQMPTGDFISPEQFSEFESAYNSFKESQKYDGEIKEAIEKSRKPILFVEGDYDIEYLKKAGILLRKTDVLEMLELKDGGGFGNLDKIKKHFDSKLCEITPQKIILLYDCDIQKNYASKGKIFPKVMPTQNENPISKGIENLFTKQTLEKARQAKSDFINITEGHKKFDRGEEMIIPEKWEVNESEKRNLCSWICENGDATDFDNFKQIFEIIDEVLAT